jgi:hypothetical protein
VILQHLRKMKNLIIILQQTLRLIQLYYVFDL